MIDRKTLEKELKEMKDSYRNLVDANILLANERNWAREDFNRASLIIERAIEYVLSNFDIKRDNTRTLLDILKGEYNDIRRDL